ncbi:hypothetical protein [Endozoicomonas arenosclerae]|uniref:hypothetical protein n=1 Tax=Endozoicomonas arenosclerae TaxID=1633495 RepID=UPI0007847452|nr:hypothetical protein [Endozoicomonas arenosclerae]
MLRGIAISSFLLFLSIPHVRIVQADFGKALSGHYKVDGKKLVKKPARQAHFAQYERLFSQVMIVAAQQLSSEQLDLTVSENQTTASPAAYHSSTHFTQRNSELKIHQQRAEDEDSRFNFFNMLPWILRIIYEEVKATGEKRTKTVKTNKFTYNINYAYLDAAFSQPVYTIRFYKMNTRGTPIYISVTVYLTADGSQIQKIVIDIDSGTTTYTLQRVEEETTTEAQESTATTVREEPDDGFQTPPETPTPSQNPVQGSQNSSQYHYSDTPGTITALEFKLYLLHIE